MTPRQGIYRGFGVSLGASGRRKEGQGAGDHTSIPTSEILAIVPAAIVLRGRMLCCDRSSISRLP